MLFYTDMPSKSLLPKNTDNPSIKETTGMLRVFVKNIHIQSASLDFIFLSIYVVIIFFNTYFCLYNIG